MSRPSVREALIALEIEGKIDVRVGSGVFVSDEAKKPISLGGEDAGEGPFERIRARIVVEGETAAHAAAGAMPAEVEEIRAAVAELHRCQSAGLPTDPADRAFHLSIARATHNGPLASVVDRLWDRGRVGASASPYGSTQLTSANVSTFFPSRNAILEGVQTDGTYSSQGLAGVAPTP